MLLLPHVAPAPEVDTTADPQCQRRGFRTRERRRRRRMRRRREHGLLWGCCCMLKLKSILLNSARCHMLGNECPEAV
jgi:hypothetical protein